MSENGPSRDVRSLVGVGKKIAFIPNSSAHLHKQNHQGRIPFLSEQGVLNHRKEGAGAQIEIAATVGEEGKLLPTSLTLVTAEEKVFGVLKKLPTSRAKTIRDSPFVRPAVSKKSMLQ